MQLLTCKPHNVIKICHIFLFTYSSNESNTVTYTLIKIKCSKFHCLTIINYNAGRTKNQILLRYNSDRNGQFRCTAIARGAYKKKVHGQRQW